MYENIQTFSIVFISILLEAFPFIMLGIIISAIIQELVSDDLIRKIIPRNSFGGAIIGVLMGFLFPVCDCAVIPVARRLIKKGVPLNVAITFMLAGPIINPIVIIATIYSFNSTIPKMFVLRSIIGVLIAVIIGYIMGALAKNTNQLKKSNTNSDCECCCSEDNHNEHNKNLWQILKGIIHHSRIEFFDIGKYLILGAFVAALAQSFIPRELMLSIGKNPILSVLAMMIFAYVISLCSTADSFVAKTFVGQFTNSSILAFLLLGPMIDIKNTLVLWGNFKSKFVNRLVCFIFVLCFLSVLILNLFIKF